VDVDVDAAAGVLVTAGVALELDVTDDDAAGAVSTGTASPG